MRTIRDVNVAVVGGAGFLGSHVVNHLVDDRNCGALVIDNLVSGRREFIHPAAEFEHADITGSEEHLLRLFVRHKTQFVCNYAARPYVPDSYDRPLRTFDVNAMGALKVINAAREAGCDAVLQVSSAELYGDAGERFYKPLHQSHGDKLAEDAPVVPHSTYGASKAAVDALCQVRWREAKSPVIALRQFNCVGPRDDLHPYVIPEIYRQLKGQTGARRTVRLGNNSRRDFMYAGDAVRMAVELLEKGQFGEIYNLGSETSIHIYDLAKLVGKVMGCDVQVQEDSGRRRSWEIWHLASSNEKIYSVIEARPTVSLEEALRRTVRYFDERAGGWAW